MLTQLRELERAHPDELVVVGVHAGKFWAERSTANIRQAVLRLGVGHPVVNDRLFRIWRSYAVNAWPTVVLLNPEGYVVDVQPGEVQFETYEPAVAELLREYARRGLLSREPLRFQPEAAAEPPRPLAFPARVLADGRRLYIADTGHHRIVVISLQEGLATGSVEAIVGRGAPGLEDGSLEQAAFNHPQGMALYAGTLYVADTDNHAVRAVDLAGRRVTTVAGTGQPTHRVHLAGTAPHMPLSSPWDLAIAGGALYIAMAGTHQLWRLDLEANELRAYAGSGAEALVDGPGSSAALAQPSGLSLGDGHLYFADSESSAIRWSEIEPGAEVQTIVGTGLFDFGDQDGMGEAVRLQHPQGLAWHRGAIYVADTYNNKIKIVDPREHTAETYLGAREAGYRDGDEPLFYEPGGLAASGDRLYVADTNNHAIRVVDLNTRVASTLHIEELQPPGQPQSS